MIIHRLFDLAKPLIFKLDSEKAHDAVIKHLNFSSRFFPKYQLNSGFNKNGFSVPSRLGLAAGFDKNAKAIEGLFNCGFGFVEIGTVTPKPQQGNSKPRLFRLAQDEAIINRMGFNNDGALTISDRLRKIRSSGQNGIIGVNVGANKETENKIADYALCASSFLDTASYFTINISSPNTTGLRDLQTAQALNQLLSEFLTVAHKNKPIPVFLKISPDQHEYNLEEIIDCVNSFPISGIITTNTTTRRENLVSSYSCEAGGLSGKPLLIASNDVLIKTKKLLKPEKILIGVGGISSAEDVLEKIALGADIIQIYTGFIYQGLRLIEQINRELNKRNFENI